MFSMKKIINQKTIIFFFTPTPMTVIFGAPNEIKVRRKKIKEG
jgi:hypothetical protein